MRKHLIIVVVGLMLILVLSACKGKETDKNISHAELDPSLTFEILKTKAIQTAQAQATLASILIPTETPPPLEGGSHDSSELPVDITPENEQQPPLETPTPEVFIPTNIPLAATYTPWAVNPQYDCRAELISPTPGQPLAPVTAFETHWRITNSGSSPWDQTSIDLVFVDGDRYHTTGDIIDLPANVSPGSTIDVFISLNSPDQNKFFQTAWILKRGNLYFCPLNLSFQTAYP